jgi:hypothetical protein
MHVLGDNISAKKNFLESIHPVFPVDKLLQY